MTTFASPRPFAAALGLAPTLWDVLKMYGCIAASKLFLIDMVDPRAPDATAIQTVSIIGAVSSVFWYMHVRRMLLGVAVWSYPSLRARIRTSYLLLAVLLATTGYVAATWWLPTSSPWAIAALSSAWAAWPLLLDAPAPRAVWIVAAFGVLLMTVLPAPAGMVAAMPWPWLAVALLTLGLTAIVFGLSPAMVRRMLQAVQSDANAGASPAATDYDEEANEPHRVLTSLSARAKAMEQVLVPRGHRPSWMPRKVELPINRTMWALYVLAAHVVSLPLMLPLLISVSGVSWHTDLWWPFGRAERRQLADQLVRTGMLMQGGFIVGALLLLELLRVPRVSLFEFTGFSGVTILNNWALLPAFVAVLPFVYAPLAIKVQYQSQWGQFARGILASGFVAVLTVGSVRDQGPFASVLICAAVFLVALAEQRWRLRRYFLRADLSAGRQ